jgi:hypothetical protein
VQDVDGLRIADGADSTPRAACLTRDNFKHRAAANPLSGFADGPV